MIESAMVILTAREKSDVTDTDVIMSYLL
jgi:hypothetical protein